MLDPKAHLGKSLRFYLADAETQNNSGLHGEQLSLIARIDIGDLDRELTLKALSCWVNEHELEIDIPSCLTLKVDRIIELAVHVKSDPTSSEKLHEKLRAIARIEMLLKVPRN